MLTMGMMNKDFRCEQLKPLPYLAFGIKELGRFGAGDTDRVGLESHEGN